MAEVTPEVQGRSQHCHPMAAVRQIQRRAARSPAAVVIHQQHPVPYRHAACQHILDARDVVLFDPGQLCDVGQGALKTGRARPRPGRDHHLIVVPLSEVATVIRFLLSDDSSFITGQLINVDGGVVYS